MAIIGKYTTLSGIRYRIFVRTKACPSESRGPNPKGPGAQVISEDWLMDNFGRDPWAGEAMIKTAENVSEEAGITREQCDAVTLRRYEQYSDALADDCAFQKRYMYPVMLQVSKKKTVMLEADEGVMETTSLVPERSPWRHLPR